MDKAIGPRGSYSREYNIWALMRQRCYNPRAANYAIYGAKGVTVCDRWKRFNNFIEDVGFSPSPKHTLDRIDPNGNYEPGNCRWATVSEQNNNKRNSVMIEAFGKRQSASIWARELGVTPHLLYSRLKSGADPETWLRQKPIHVRPVVQLKDGAEIARYDSFADAGKALGVDKRGIWNAAAGKAKAAHGYQWKYAS